MAKDLTIVVADLTGGINTFDPALAIADNQCLDAVNVDWWASSLGSKRLGSTAARINEFVSGGPFTGALASFIRHVPGDDEFAAQLWAVDTGDRNRIAYATPTTKWTAVTLDDLLQSASDTYHVTGATLNAMLYLTYNAGTENRLHVYDSTVAAVRRVGLATAVAPATAAMGAGAVSFTRSYRVRWVDISGSDTRRISEPSTAATRTIAAKLGVTVTQPALPGERETHWDVEYADAATGPWYRAARILKATTTYDDTAATIDTTTLSAAEGINYPPPSAKFIVADGARLIMANGWETSIGTGFVTPKSTRVWFTPVLGSSDIGDSERIPSGNYLDVDAPITGLSQPMRGTIYVFAYRQMWRLTPTGLASAPYVRTIESTSVGCIRHQTIVSAVDENGNPAIYFLSDHGPYRIGSQGLQYLGSDIEGIWDGVNLNAATVVGHGLFYPFKHQIWWWIATGSSDTPNKKIVFDTRNGRTEASGAVRQGWSRGDGLQAAALTSALFIRTAALSNTRLLSPWIGQTASVGQAWVCDLPSDANFGAGIAADTDFGTAYRAYLDTKEYAPAGLLTNIAITDPQLVAKAESGGTIITVAVTGDFGRAGTASTGTVDLTPENTETRIHRKVEGLQTANVGSVSFRIGDAAAVAGHFDLDALVVPVTEQERR